MIELNTTVCVRLVIGSTSKEEAAQTGAEIAQYLGELLEEHIRDHDGFPNVRLDHVSTENESDAFVPIVEDESTEVAPMGPAFYARPYLPVIDPPEPVDETQAAKKRVAAVKLRDFVRCNIGRGFGRSGFFTGYVVEADDTLLEIEVRTSTGGTVINKLPRSEIEDVEQLDPRSCRLCSGTGMPPAGYKPEPDLMHAWDGYPPCPDCDGRGRYE